MADEWDVAEGAVEEPKRRVLLYSDHAQTREAVLLGAGTRVAKDLPPIEWVEVATHAMVISRVEKEHFDLLVLDGEAGKAGGMGLCRQLKDEIFRCPPVLVLVARREDLWLASWSDADAVLARPLDPLELQETIARMLRVPVEGGR
jgi:DNA-binding response OmpR family regulator